MNICQCQHFIQTYRYAMIYLNNLLLMDSQMFCVCCFFFLNINKASVKILVGISFSTCSIVLAGYISRSNFTRPKGKMLTLIANFFQKSFSNLLEKLFKDSLLGLYLCPLNQNLGKLSLRISLSILKVSR